MNHNIFKGENICRNGIKEEMQKNGEHMDTKEFKETQLKETHAFELNREKKNKLLN